MNAREVAKRWYEQAIHDLYQSPSQSSQKTAVETPSFRFPLRAGGTEPLRGSPREAGGTYGGGHL